MIKKILKSSFLSTLLFFTLASISFAGSDLDVNCSAIGTCTLSPVTSLFKEVNWLPGSTVTQQLTVADSAVESGFVGIEAAGYLETGGLGEIITIEIREGSATGPIIYGPVSMKTFKNDGYFTIDSISSGQTIEYFLTADMPVSVGNEYQSASIVFDLNLGLELTPISPSSGAGDGIGTAQPPVCTAQVPSSAPVLSITSTGTNTVSLAWTPVSPVSHYALVFTRDRDGAAYGSPNIGNVTNYTVSNLSGGDSYTFEVFGVNDCAPGDRSNQVNTGLVTGGVIAGRPQGPGGEVLGVTDDKEVQAESGKNIAGQKEGRVAGATTTACQTWIFYLPLILLVVEALATVFIEFLQRKQPTMAKWVSSLVISIGLTVLFYFLRDCHCSEINNWLAWLCKYYWIVAVLVWGVIRMIGYAFIEEISN